MGVTEKGLIGTFITMWAYIVGEFNILTAVMLVIILSDFGTGTLRVWFNKEPYNAEVAFRGVIKKFLYIFLWFIAVIMQLVLKDVGPSIGVTITTPVISLIITAWIIGTELASIMDNLNKMGVKTHKLFGKIAKELIESDDDKKVG
jgi:toxin secretion/phage lysis holin